MFDSKQEAGCLTESRGVKLKAGSWGVGLKAGMFASKQGFLTQSRDV